MAYELAHGKLHQTEDEHHDGYRDEECPGGVGVYYVLDGGAGDNHQRAAPHVVCQIFNRYYGAVKPLHPVFHYVCQQHRHNEHHANLIKNERERLPERHLCPVVYEREAYRNEYGRDEV